MGGGDVVRNAVQGGGLMCVREACGWEMRKDRERGTYEGGVRVGSGSGHETGPQLMPVGDGGVNEGTRKRRSIGAREDGVTAGGLLR